MKYNRDGDGEGIIPIQLTSDEALLQTLQQIMTCYGEEQDRSGEPGGNQEKINLFLKTLKPYQIGFLTLKMHLKRYCRWVKKQPVLRICNL